MGDDGDRTHHGFGDRFTQPLNGCALFALSRLNRHRGNIYTQTRLAVVACLVDIATQNTPLGAAAGYQIQVNIKFAGIFARARGGANRAGNHLSCRGVCSWFRCRDSNFWLLSRTVVGHHCIGVKTGKQTAHLNSGAALGMQQGNGATAGHRNLYHGFVGLYFAEQVIFLDLVAFFYVPLQ